MPVRPMQDESPKRWPPLGLPTGSVRALLTLIVVGVVVLNLSRGRRVDLLWIETLLIALAHYFTSRRFIALPPDVLERLEEEGVIEREFHPLFLPRHSIRLIIIAAFGWLAFDLYQSGRIREPQPMSLLGILAAYLAGALIRTVTGWFNRRRVKPPSRFWADARAVIVLAVLLLVAIPELTSSAPIFKPEFELAALGLVLFYFGSR